jgi:hypothetical protein
VSEIRQLLIISICSHHNSPAHFTYHKLICDACSWLLDYVVDAAAGLHTQAKEKKKQKHQYGSAGHVGQRRQTTLDKHHTHQLCFGYVGMAKRGGTIGAGTELRAMHKDAEAKLAVFAVAALPAACLVAWAAAWVLLWLLAVQLQPWLACHQACKQFQT